MHRSLGPETIGVPNTGYDGRPAPTNRKPLITGDHCLCWLPNLSSSQADPQPEQGLTPIVAMSVAQIKRGDWSGGAGRGFVDLGAGIAGELSTGSAYQEPVQGGALVGRQCT
jgi:hypothetical protein